jgi:hypothetical protein
MDHLQACPHCPHFVQFGISIGCSKYKDTSWVNRRGGCPGFPYREIPRNRGEYVDGQIVAGKQRPGQQKQKVADRKYDNRKANRKYGSKNI